MGEPRTKAGRALFGRLWAVNDYDMVSRIIATVAEDIAAIEAEARIAAIEAEARPVIGRWIETCGCERRTYVKDLRYVVTGGSKPCDAPHPHDPDDPPSVATEAGWCGCGEHDDIDRWMLAYLESLTPDWPAPVGIPTEAAVLLAYVAAELDWTEHGTSIRFPWLTDNGRLVLKELRSRADPS